MVGQAVFHFVYYIQFSYEQQYQEGSLKLKKSMSNIPLQRLLATYHQLKMWI